MSFSRFWISLDLSKGLGSDCISRAHCSIWEKLGTALQAYTLNPCTKLPPNLTSRKELTSQHRLNSSIYADIHMLYKKDIKNKEIEPYNNIYLGMHATFSSSAEMLTLKVLTFLEVGFWGNLVQGFMVYA